MNENNSKLSNNENANGNLKDENSKVLMRKNLTNINSNIPKPATNKRYSLNISENSTSTNSPSGRSKLPVLKRQSSHSTIDSPQITYSNSVSTEAISEVTKKDNNNNTIINTTQQTPIMKSTRTVTTPTKTSSFSKPTTPSKFQQFKQELKLTKQKSQNFDEVTFSSQSDATLSNNPKVFNKLFKQARINGSINLSSFQLTQIPLKVLKINIDKFDEENANDDDNDENGFKWWQQVDLQKLLIASNKLKEVPKDIQFLETLITFDAHDNEIETVNEAIGCLNNLQTLNLSHNSIRTLPNDICKLRNLITVNLAYNQLQQLPKEFGYLDYLEDLNLSHNELTELPKSFGYFTKLRTFNASSNKLVQLLPEVFYSQHLKFIDLSENQIEKIPIEAGELINLEQFYLSKNRIKEFPFLKNCCNLKDLDFSYNAIKEIKTNYLKNLVSLITFNVRENQISVLPNDICDLKKLERLDLTNNGLLNLPTQLALLENLKQILLTGNPLRTIRKDVLNRGTDAIIKSLKMHLEIPAETASHELNGNNKDIPPLDVKSDIVKASRAFDYSCKKATEFPLNCLKLLQQSQVHTINLSKNLIKTLPDEIESLNENLTNLNYSLNQLTNLSNVIYKLKSLIILDLRGNQLSQIDSSISKLDSLRELIIADNRFTEIPDGIFDLKNLENLFANNNQIQVINVKRMMNLKRLATLNLQNNNISHVPPELGKAENIKSLQLEGNPFRLPRPTILAKGTQAILEYLRGRIVETNDN